MLEIRMGLTMNEQEREKLKRDYPEIAKRVAKAWNGGQICGQCRYFSQIGTEQGRVKNTGLNGACAALMRGGYVKPEDVKCSRFENHER